MSKTYVFGHTIKPPKTDKYGHIHPSGTAPTAPDLGVMRFCSSGYTDKPRVPVIVAFGDSFTAGLGLPRGEAFPFQLEAWLRAHGKSARVVNAGKSGDTTEAALSRLGKALAEHPDIVILELGTNDALRGVDPGITQANLGTIITKFRENGVKHLLLTGILAPPNWGEEYRHAFNRVYPDLASSYNVPLYPFFLQGVQGVPAALQLNQPEGLHPNARGVEVIVNRLGPVVTSLFFAEHTPAKPQ